MRRLKAATRKRMAWKNNGGETIEIAVHPEGAGLAAFDWRLSMATVSADGPFSVFPGVDRTLALLSGEGMELAVEGRGLHRLTTASEPLAFPADAPATARLLAGPVTDLNVMTRRGAFAHRVERRRVEDKARIPLAGRWTLLVLMGDCRVAADGFDEDLRRNDAVVAERPGKILVAAPAAVDLFVVAIEAEG